jgi:tripartite-type tricarboxylate transporter receptor subunit TctC
MSLERIPMRLVVRLSASLVALAAMSAAAVAADYPTRPVKLVVPYAAGGPTDVAGRLIAQALRTPLGQSVYVENRGGGGGIPGTELVINAPPDGYTILLGAPGPLVISPAIRAARYDVEKELAPIGLIWRSPQVLVVNPKLGVKTMAEFVALAKAKPGKLNVGSAGNGTTAHLSLELLKREAGVDLIHVPYRSTGAGLPDLLSGQVDAAFGDVSVMAPQVTANGLVGLAITSKERSSLLPDLVTTAEAAYPTLIVENIYGLVTRAGVPADALKQLQTAVQTALADPDYRANLTKHGASVADASAEQYRALLRSETERWGPIARAAGLKLE